MRKLLSPLQIHQPRFATADPKFIAGYDIAGGNVECTEHDLHLFLPQRGNARSAFRAKAPSFESPQVSSALISRSRPNAEEGERTAACAPTILAMAKSNAQGCAFNQEANPQRQPPLRTSSMLIAELAVADHGSRRDWGEEVRPAEDPGQALARRESRPGHLPAVPHWALVWAA